MPERVARPTPIALIASLAWLGLATAAIPAELADDAASAGGGHRPRIALVLGGGGAKGAAHIGVLKVLEEMRVPVDCIAGTSMGALIGATYAAGMRPAEIERSVRGIDWALTLGNQGFRDRMPIEEKLAVSNYSNTLDLGLTGGRLRGRGGLISTQNVEDLLSELVASAQFTEDFDDLPIPYRAVATDMMQGQMVVLGEGDLALAMRASMAIPGAFAPVETEGMVLADGGMMRNLPVDVARELCGDIVIAVWLSSPQPTTDAFSSSLGMINRALDVMVGTNQAAQIASLTATDVGIEVPMGDIGPADFTRVGDAIDLGLAAADRHRKALARYSLPVREYTAWSERVHAAADDTYVLDGVAVVGLDRVNPGYVETQLVNTRTGGTVGVADIVADVERVYALGDFERIEYHLTGPAAARTLEIRPIEKSWGPNFVSFDYGIETRDGADLNAILRADHELTWVNHLGGRWHNALQLGRQSLVATDFYQPLDPAQRFFLQPMLRFESKLEDLYLDANRFTVYDIREWYGQLDAGINVGTRLQARLGLRHGWQSAKLDTGLSGLFPELPKEKDTSVQLRLTYDTRDVVSLPTRGTFFSMRYASSEKWFGSELDYSVIEAVLLKAFDLNGNSLNFMFGGASTLSGSTPVSQLIELGGIRTFPGLRPGELRGSDYWFAGTSYAWRLADIQPLFGQALYGGFRLQTGRMRDELQDGGADTGVLYGVSGSLSGRTPIGPFMLSLGYVIDEQVRLQFMLGRPVPEGSLLDDLH